MTVLRPPLSRVSPAVPGERVGTPQAQGHRDIVKQGSRTMGTKSCRLVRVSAGKPASGGSRFSSAADVALALNWLFNLRSHTHSSPRGLRSRYHQIGKTRGVRPTYDILRWVEAHPGLAAWVQAVGSVFAATAAASLPFIHGYLTEKRETKVRLAALFALAQQSVILLEDLAEAMKTESGMRDYMHLGVTGEWTELRAMLASFPLWDVVQQDLATQIGHLRHAVTVGH